MSDTKSRRRRERRRQAARVAIGTGVGIGTAAAMATPAMADDFTVTTLGPDGAPGSLRAQVDAANNEPGADRILFQSGLSGTVGLTEGTIQIADDLEIVGPGAATIQVDGGSNSGVFRVYGESQTPIQAGISGLTVQNAYSDFGGAILTANADLTIENSVITGNRSYFNGAGIYAGLAGSLTIKDTTVSRNTSGTGGGIFVGDQDVLIQGSTFERNRATQFGGALVAAYGHTPRKVEIENSTFSRNTGGLAGGAITPLPVVEPEEGVVDPTLEVRSSTISGNQAVAVGGGISGGFSSASIDNSIVSGNSAIYGPDLYSGSFGGPPMGRAGDDCSCYYETTFDTAFSLVEDASQAEINETVAGSNILNKDPELKSLADNGGPTKTLAVGTDSPVVNQGSSPLITDQRGLLRPVLFTGIANSTAAGANGADMGAFELQNVEPPPPPPPPPAPPGSGPFKILDSTPKADGSAIVRVEVPAEGVVTLVGYKRLKTSKKRVNAKGIFKFRAMPKGNMKKKLNKRGRARILVKFHYRPDAGRTLTKGRIFPFFKGSKGMKAKIAAFRKGRQLAPWAGR